MYLTPSTTLSRLMLAALTVTLFACEERPEAPRLQQTETADDVVARVDSANIRAHLRFLSNDLLEGRGTGTRGEDLAVEYISAQMEAAGLEPAGDDGGWFQNVPLLGSQPEPRGPLTFRPETGDPLQLEFIDGYIASTDLDAQSVTVTAPLVFVGYGVHAPGYDWDDYGDVDISGKVIVSFVNDPPATTEEPDLFQADTLTYFGRWTYKYEEARRRGAAGALLIHTDETAGYPFTVLTAGAREQIQLADVPESALELKGWIPQPSAERLAAMSGSTLAEWFEMAATREFTPIELPVTVSSTIDYEVRRFEGRNVIGMLRGTDRPAEAIVFTSHHDHLGMDEEGNIYNGAVDNATGVGMLLSAARAFGSAARPPQRSLIFVTVTAEESGLLGSTYYAQNPVTPADLTVANINLDMCNVWGPTDDIVGLGAEKSELGLWFRDAAHTEGLTVTPDTQPGQGLFFRSDQLSFARQGIPAVFINTGNQFRNRPPGYFDEVMTDFRQNRYHQPGDEFDPEWPMAGLVQKTRVAVRLANDLANSDAFPAYYPTEAFAEIRAVPEPARP